MNYAHLRARLKVGAILYTTRRDTDYTLYGWTPQGDLRFGIPSRTTGHPPNIKTIPRQVLTRKQAPTFTDCRRSVLLAIREMK